MLMYDGEWAMETVILQGRDLEKVKRVNPKKKCGHWIQQDNVPSKQKFMIKLE